MKIEFDYSLDANGFFDAPERREALEYAGNVWSNLLEDDFESIPVGSQFTITNPTTGTAETIILDAEIDDIRIFVGSGTLEDDGNNLKADLNNNSFHLKACACSHCSHSSHGANNKIVNLSQPGILDTENSVETDSLLAQAQVNGTDLKGDIFQRRVSGDFRDTGVVTDFEPWAGTISFSPSETINWNFDLVNTDDSSIDFISVALHEIGHILGIGVAPIFDLLGEGGTFDGTNALAANNGVGIPLEDNLSHVREGFSDNSVLLDPLLNENRNAPSDFDLAILADIGYEIAGFSKQGSLPEVATEAAEDIIGSNLDDNIDGLSGDDKIQGNDGDDTISGGLGNDTIFATAGADLIFGNEGIDSLHGGLGADIINGGADNDLLIGAEDNDWLVGGAGDDELQGNTGEDTIQGGVGNDSLFGQEGADFLLGNEGADRLQGGAGNDSLQGNEDEDILLGQEGDDLFDGGAGNDTLVGGSGSDRFFFGLDNGKDTINDFVVGEDTIEIIADFGFNKGSEVLAAITNTGSTVDPEGLFSEVTLAAGNTISIFHDTELVAESFSIVSESGLGTAGLNVVAVTPNSSGIDLQLNTRLNTEVLDIADFTLTNSSNETVSSSLIWHEDNLTLSIVATGDVLDSNTYNLTLFSGEDSFISATGDLLDGNNDNTIGDDFATQFTIASTDERVLSLDDFNLAAGENTTLDISLDNGDSIDRVEFAIAYNPDIFSIDDLSLDSTLSEDWTITTEDISTPGIAIITLEGTTPLNVGEVDLVELQVTIPDTATYGVSDLISLEDIQLNEGNINVVGDTALQTVALTGDVDADGSYSHLDSYLISQVAVGLSDSFDAFAGKDPLLVADINQDGVISAMDSFLVAQKI